MWTGDDRVFFFNPTTQLSVWEKPEDLERRGDLGRIIDDPPHKRKLAASAGTGAESACVSRPRGAAVCKALGSLFQDLATASVSARLVQRRRPRHGACSGSASHQGPWSAQGRPSRRPFQRHHGGQLTVAPRVSWAPLETPHASNPRGCSTALHRAVRCRFEGILAFGGDTCQARDGAWAGRQLSGTRPPANLVPQTQRGAFSVFRKDPFQLDLLRVSWAAVLGGPPQARPGDLTSVNGSVPM